VLTPWKDPDWFVTDQDTIRPIAASPGIKLLTNYVGQAPQFGVHRSHVALMQTDDAMRLLNRLGWNGYDDAAERDRRTEPLGFKLKHTQHKAVDFIRARRGTLLGDEPRVGKTLAAAFSHEPSMGKLVVVAPLMVREVWLSWLRRIWPGEDIGVMAGRDFDPEAAKKPIVFGHYDVLYYWQSGDAIGTLILDEAHALTNPRSRRTLAATMLASRATRVVAATGTPIWNLPSGLWSVLGLVAPGAFGSYHDFCMRYGAPEPTAYGNVYTGLSNGEELSTRLTEIMIRRRWKDVQDDLPPITRNVIVVDLTAQQRRKLDIEAESMRQSAKTSTAASLARYRSALSSVKVAATVEQAKKYMLLGEPVVIWAWHRNTVDKIVERLVADGFEALPLTGDTPVHRRESLLNLWRAPTNAALVVTMSVAQVGIDLSHSHLPLFAEVDYTPAMIAQAEMRTFSPMRAMSATYVVADHYVDRKIVAALSRKLEAAAPVDLGTGEGAIASIDAAFRGPEDVADLDRFMQDIFAS
jgi:superfamily II DNA or RNA helicase